MGLLVIFDIDGTLLFSNKIDSQLFSETFESRYGQKFPSIDWDYFPHVTDHTIFTMGYAEIHEETPTAKEIIDFQDEFAERISLAREKTPEEFMPVPGVQDLFARLHLAPDYHLAIATGGWSKPARVKLEHVGLFHDDLVISAADNQPTREDIVNQAKALCQDRNYRWKQEVYIGDASWDVRTCRNLAMPFIGLRRDGDHNVLLEQGVNRVFSNYNEPDVFLEALHAAQVPD